MTPTLPSMPLPLPLPATAAMPTNPAAFALPPPAAAPQPSGLPPLPGAPPPAAGAPAPAAAAPIKRATQSSQPMSLATAGFDPQPRAFVPRLILCTQANEKCGKTDFAFRNTPGDIACVSFDAGTRAVLEDMRRINPHKTYHYMKFKPPKEANKRGEMTQQEAVNEWDRYLAAIMAVRADKRIRTLVLDTATEAWELCRLAIIGRLEKVPPFKYEDANLEFKNWIKDINDDEPGLNVMLIHKVSPVYEPSTNGMGNKKPGVFERKGFGDIHYLADVVAENIKYQDPTGQTPGERFGLAVYGTRYNAAQVGGLRLWDANCSFETLGMYCFPETAGTDYWRTIGR